MPRTMRKVREAVALRARFARNLSTGYSSRKVVSASTSEASASRNVVALDWESVKSGKDQLPVYKHIELGYAKFRPDKVKSSMFFGDPKVKIESAWKKAHELEIKPIITEKNGKKFDHYIVPFENAGCEYSGGLAQGIAEKSGANPSPVFPNTVCDYITISVESGTNKLKTAYPSSRTADFKAKDYLK